jgi:alginate O-acetyltransferase complex protein AlgI
VVFSSPVFLFLFLPVTLGLYFVLPTRLRNVWLLAASLVFYGWGEPKFVAVMVASIAINFLLVLWIDRVRDTSGGWLPLALAIVANLGLLVAFKYTDFLTGNLNALLAPFGIQPIATLGIALPIGISFFTFQALSYVIDVHRRVAPVQRNPLNIGLYIALFPQLIAGPIVRYVDVARQIEERTVTRSGFAYGVERFVIGLGKKVLLANSLAVPADLIFAIPGDQLSAPVAWLGVICYALQIYFDFSGYSDMAIGLGHMFGFRFLENFRHPYVAQSLTDFWRRWHISLSTWFRDYLYVPLGGNRVAPWRVYTNLFIVFFLCGLWHGASWNFVIWGLYHGAFLVLERMGLGRSIARWYPPFRHVYLLLVVLISWVFFRAETLPQAMDFLRAMAGLSNASGLEHPFPLYADRQVIVALVIGAIAATPIAALLKRRIASASGRATAVVAGLGEVAVLATMLLAAAMLLAAGTYNPFIYFRF